MKIITEGRVESLGITPAQCVEWVETSFKSKPQADMPPKISVHPFEDSFYTAMPCYHPDVGRVGVKIVSRVPGATPPLKSTMMLYDAKSSGLLAMMEANWITSMRTGAVAALAAKTFCADFEASSFGMVGLGNIARSVFKCLVSQFNPSRKVDVWLLNFGNEAQRFIETFKSCAQVNFHVTDSREELIANTNVLFSCVTVMHDQFLPESTYPKGYTLIPVHVRGFQDCDLTFDKIFGDDSGHMRGWKNFDHYKQFSEFSDVLLGKVQGRTSPDERIISYNYGLALHDLWFSSKIYDKLAILT